MTRNPSDSGLLLAWYHGGEIRVLRNDSIGNTFLWNGRNASGQEVPSGTYFIRAESTGGHALLALVKL